MIALIKYDQLGKADYGWLQARYHFSFANFYDPKRMGFGKIRVINDDLIQPGSGFDMHPHKDMEIITYVKQGAITHKDNQGNDGRTEAGNIQVMSAGRGITHSEYNLEDEQTSLYQIWIEPKVKSIKPTWSTKEFPIDPVIDKLQLLVSGDGNAPLSINQEAYIYGGVIAAGHKITHAIKFQAYILVVDGTITIDGETASKGDAVEVTNQTEMSLLAEIKSEVLVIDVE